MRPVVVLALLVLSGCQTMVKQHAGNPPPLPPVEEVVPSDHSTRSSPKVPAEPAISPSNEAIKSALDAADKAQETVERRRSILDSKSDKKVSP